MNAPFKRLSHINYNMEKSGDGRGSPPRPPKRPGSTVLGVRTVQGVLPDQFKLPAPILEALAKPPQQAEKRHSEPPPAIEVQEGLDITEINMREGEVYRVESVLGQGGFGIVYRGTHLVESLQAKGTYVIDDPVAIKVISFNEGDLQAAPEGPDKARDELNRRFEVEVMLAKKLKHPNIVAIETFAQLSDGRPFYVMELLNGMDLGAILSGRRDIGEGPLDWGKVKPVMIQVCKALDTAHTYEEKGVRKPVIHRDIKPENIFIVTSKVGEWEVKVLDFGLAKIIAPSNPEVTKKGEGVGGSPWYMSPEQAWGLTVDERSDIWSVGATMYELLTGRPPFEFQILDKRETQTSDEYNDYRVKKWAEIRDRLWNEKPRPFSVVCPGINVPEEVEEIVFKCMEKKPQYRFQSVAELKAAIELVNGVLNGNGGQNGQPTEANGSVGIAPEPAAQGKVPSFEPPVIVDEELLSQTDPHAFVPESDVAGSPYRRTPNRVPVQGQEAEIPDLSDEQDHKTLPRYEKTEIVRVRDIPQGSSKRPTVPPATARKKFSKWLIAGAIAGSLAVTGVGAGLLYYSSRPDSTNQSEQSVNPSATMNPPAHIPIARPIAVEARDGGADEARAVASQDAVSPLAADAGEPQDTAVTPEHRITLNTGLPGVKVLVWSTEACRTDANGACTLTLPAQTDAIRLTFRKRGYTEVHRDVIPDEDREVRVSLERTQAARPPQNPPTKVPGRPPRITSE